MIEYSPVFKVADVSGADEIGNWNINGQEVEYAYIDRPGREVVAAYLNLDEAGINATYFFISLLKETRRNLQHTW